jgi:hypothetical protein
MESFAEQQFADERTFPRAGISMGILERSHGTVRYLRQAGCEDLLTECCVASPISSFVMASGSGARATLRHGEG